MKITTAKNPVDGRKALALTNNLEGYEDIMNEIAEELAYNYIMNSFGDKEKNSVLIDRILNTDGENYENSSFKFPEMNQEMTNRIKYNQRCRNIIVLGAGASHEAYNAIPLGANMVNAFKREYAEKLSIIPFLKNKFENEEDEVIKLSKNGIDFENFFQILSNYVGHAELREKIKEYTGFKYAPCLLNEVIAHLLKHSFIDAVINFNFDELLDNAIDDELGSDNYRKVVSDGDCPSLDDLIVDGRLKLPLYIKPHGTFSHPSSLRFTKKQYLDISTGIENILSQLLSGYRGHDEDNFGSNEKRADYKPVDRINLILIGFNLASVEFNKLLEQRLPVYSKIYHFQWNNDKNDDKYYERNYIKNVLPVFFERVRDHFRNASEKINGKENHDYQRENKIYKFISVKDFNTNATKNEVTKPYAEIMTVLWRLTHYRFKKPYQPRSISRHELISYLFEGYTPLKSFDIDDGKSQRLELRNKYDYSRTFFLDRLIVEIAIALSRNDGIVDVVELLLHRVGIFYAHYTRICQYKKNKTQKVYSIYELLKDFALYSKNGESKQFLYSDNIFKIADINCDIFRQNLAKNIKERDIDSRESTERYIGFLMNKFDKTEKKLKHRSTKAIEELPKVESLIFHLLAHPKLSKRFRENLYNKCQLSVHNGLFYKDKENYSTATVYDEIVRSFVKSSKTHYFHIQPKYFDCKNLLWETFSKKNISHTNLSFKYLFWQLFYCKNNCVQQNWDVFLSIMELGSILDFINSTSIKSAGSQNGNTFVAKKNIMLLCSLESSRQKYQNELSVDSEEQNNEKGKNGTNKNPNRHFRKMHTEHLKGDNNLDIMYMPYWQHNNHVNLFLKKLDMVFNDDKEKIKTLRTNVKSVEFENEDTGKIVFFEVVGSIYVHRRGFSNSINPINISGDDLDIDKMEGLKRDNKKLLSLFFNNFCRAITFESSNNLSDLKEKALSDNSAQDNTLNHRISALVAKEVSEIEKYKNWDSEEYHKKMNTFYYHLYINLPD